MFSLKLKAYHFVLYNYHLYDENKSYEPIIIIILFLYSGDNVEIPYLLTRLNKKS